MFIIASQDDIPFDLTLSRGEYDEILNRILHVYDRCDSFDRGTCVPLHEIAPTVILTEELPSTSYEEPSVISFFLNELLRKIQPFGESSSRDATQTCFSTWLSSEELCRQSNNMLAEREVSTKTSVVLARARELVYKVLSKTPDLSRVIESSGPGPGATYHPARGRNGQYFKYNQASHLTVTKPALQYIEPLIGDDELWSRALGLSGHYGHDRFKMMLSKIELVKGNRLTTVPKSAATDRAICVEPGLNAMLQLGVGRTIRQLLKVRAGIDLNRQHVLHRELVLFQWAEISTIDLRSASDTIAYQLVKEILPPDWFKLLSSLRCEYTLVPGGKWWRNEKFSSMGNGFTFELESLIFWAISTATLQLHRIPRLRKHPGFRQQHCSVYGDDIITPLAGATVVMEQLEAVGFSVNTGKTFTAGQAVRESCGTFSLMGVEIPQFNLKRLQRWTDVLSMHNNLFRRSVIAERGGLFRLKSLIDTLCEEIAQLVPVALRHFGPPTGVLDAYLFRAYDCCIAATRADWRRLPKRREYHMVLDSGERTYKDEPLLVVKLSPLVRPSFTRFDPTFIVPVVQQQTAKFVAPASDYFGQAPYALKHLSFGGFDDTRGAKYRMALLILSRNDSVWAMQQ